MNEVVTAVRAARPLVQLSLGERLLVWLLVLHSIGCLLMGLMLVQMYGAALTEMSGRFWIESSLRVLPWAAALILLWRMSRWALPAFVVHLAATVGWVWSSTGGFGLKDGAPAIGLQALVVVFCLYLQVRGRLS